MDRETRDPGMLAAFPRLVAVPLTTETTFEDDSALIVVVGDLDVRTCDDVMSAAQAAVDRGATRLTFDMAGVGFMDSTGIRVLLRACAIAPVTLRNPSRQVRLVIDMTGLDEALPIE